MQEPQQILSLIAAVLTFGVATVLLLMVVRSRTPMRPVVIALWLLALLGVYSASSFVWAAHVEDWFLSLTRLATLSIRTIIFILLVGVVDYIRRRP